MIFLGSVGQHEYEVKLNFVIAPRPADACGGWGAAQGAAWEWAGYEPTGAIEAARSRSARLSTLPIGRRGSSDSTRNRLGNL